jgi:hypothetical protein
VEELALTASRASVDRRAVSAEVSCRCRPSPSQPFRPASAIAGAFGCWTYASCDAMFRRRFSQNRWARSRTTCSWGGPTG